MRARLLENGNIEAPIRLQTSDVLAHAVREFLPGTAEYEDFMDDLTADNRNRAERLHARAVHKMKEAKDGQPPT
jgi:hypothetical protein